MDTCVTNSDIQLQKEVCSDYPFDSKFYIINVINLFYNSNCKNKKRQKLGLKHKISFKTRENSKYLIEKKKKKLKWIKTLM